MGVSIVEPFTARDFKRDGIAIVPFEPRIRYRCSAPCGRASASRRARPMPSSMR